ncbi:MAG: DUF7275 domain-containing protein [Brevibacterium sp.]|uniref:DUF7275 domain-containing protein n=1 Tax=Brevibacterium aurantiacum TaxID=273384 RepID=UPI003F8F2450
MLTLIGSRAMRHWFPDAREPKGDWDYHSPEPAAEMPEGMPPPLGVRFDIFEESRLGAWEWGPVATPSELYTMKISHSFWEINGPESWNKHAADIVFLERKGAVLIRELHDILRPIWKERYKRNPTNLEQNASMFFADAVDRKYDHDSLHASVAYFDSPLFERILRDGSDVAVDNAKFWAMDFETQIKLVREEIYATALERIVIPRDYKVSPRWAYHWAVRRTATSLFKGEWALFLMKNLDLLMKPDIDYVQRHQDQADRLILLEKRETAA